MRLGKALATGVAEEQSAPRDEELRIPEAFSEELSEEAGESTASAPEEVPAAR